MSTNTRASASRVLDAVIEAPIVTSFTRIGYDVRSRAAGWTKLDAYDLRGRTMLVTGATSGLGYVTAAQLAANGASVILLGRNGEKTRAVREQLVDRTGNEAVSVVLADMGELDQVRTAAAQILAEHDRLDVVIHNAGALSAERTENSEGVEATVASQVLGPFLLTGLLLDRLAGSAPARVITMSSGGMYATGLHVDDLEMGDDYRGAEQYARAKRAQVTLNEIWAQRWSRDGRIRYHAVHPGWADTPGVASSLPTFRRVVGPLLRTPEQGADTVVWLAADDGQPVTSTGRFWLDRRPRSLHKLPTTSRTDTPEQRERLWQWCLARTGL